MAMTACRVKECRRAGVRKSTRFGMYCDTHYAEGVKAFADGGNYPLARWLRANTGHTECICGARPWEYEPCECGNGPSPGSYYGMVRRLMR